MPAIRSAVRTSISSSPFLATVARGEVSQVKAAAHPDNAGSIVGVQLFYINSRKWTRPDRSPATILLSPEKAQQHAGASQVKVVTSSPVSRYHTNVWFSEADTARRPSLLTSTPVTPPEWRFCPDSCRKVKGVFSREAVENKAGIS